MINDHVTFSARAERPRKVLGHLVALAVGGSLLLASPAALGTEISGADSSPVGALDQIALPPIPYLDTMPWLSWQPAAATIKVDTLLSPVLGPSGVKLDLPPPHHDGPYPAMS